MARRSKYARKEYYEVRTHEGNRLVSRHNTLMAARRAVIKKGRRGIGGTLRICNQDGRWYL